MRKKYSRFGYDKFIEFREFTDEIYKSSKEAFLTIARHLRKTILMDHRTCIKRLVKRAIEEDVCPYAYAYVMWRSEIEELDWFWDFLRRKKGYRRKRNSIEFFSRLDNDYLGNLYDTLKDAGERFSPVNVTESKWIFSHVMGHLLISHFWWWLSESTKMIEKRNFRGRSERSFEYIPFYILKLPETNETGIEFYWWSKKIV